jgi:hypothetical protein
MNRTELTVDYDSEMTPICATCTRCGERMPAPPVNLHGSADIIGWFGGKYIEHRQKHSQDDRRLFPRD